ncbi:MAG: hypothetical protein ACLQVI_35350 [Polyangiaceae bacterium]|jgi:hypothetical protein
MSSSNQTSPAAKRYTARAPWERWLSFRRWRDRTLALLRLTAYAVFALFVSAAVGTRVVLADLREGTLQAGRELASLGDVLGTTKTIFINGATMNVSNALTSETPKEVLDRFETVCRAHPQFLARALEDIPATLQDKVTAAVPNESVRLGVMRTEANGDGALTCFMDDRPWTVKDIPTRLKAFSKSYDLSEFGRLRYVYATSLPQGTTRVTTVWSDSSVSLKEMFPAKGDAAGEDTTVVARPPSSRRILSAAAAQVPFGVYLYDSTLNKQALREYYDAQMKSLGWVAANGGVERKNTVVYVADAGNMLYLTLTPKDRHTLVAATQTTRTGSPSEVVVHVPN